MLAQSWAVYFISLALLLGSTAATPIRIYEVEEPDTTPSNPLVRRAASKPCTASQAEYIYPTKMTGTAWTWARKCIELCKAGTTLQLDPKTKKYDCKAANCKRAGGTGTGPACTLPKCNAKTEDMFQGKCVPKCKAPMVRNPTTGKCEAAKTTTTKCTATQELFNGKCVAKCKAPMVRNPTTGKCEAAKTTTTKCTATQELFNGKCVAKCKAPMVRNAAGQCAAATKTTTTKCTATQELFNGKCVAKCKAPKKRNASGVCQ